MIDRDESQTHLLRFHRSRLPVALNSKLILACYQSVEAIKEAAKLNSISLTKTFINSLDNCFSRLLFLDTGSSADLIKSKVR